MAPLRKADAPPVSPRRRTDTPSVSWSAPRDGGPKTPPPPKSEPRGTLGPRSTPTSVAVDPTSPNPRLQQATHRNLARIEEANLADNVTIGELGYLIADPAFYFAVPEEGPDDAFDTPSWFLRALHKIASTTVQVPDKATIRFEVSAKAAEYNANLLRAVNYSIPDLLASQRGSTVSFGSEFRPVEQLRGLLSKHPGFAELAQVLTYGMDYRYSEELTDDERLEEMLANLQRGNHKSAQEESDQVAKLLKKDVDHGFAWVIPKHLVPLIPGSMVQSLGLAKQWTLDGTGARVPKYRLTQDLSFTCVKGNRGLSINSRIDMGAYPEMIYGWCLSRILHYIIALRLAFPDTPILIAKYDYSDAYRRVAHSATAVAQTISTCDDLAYVYNRLTFGGSPNPPTWCNFSEIVTDLANEISQCKRWDPKTLRSPDQPVTPNPIREQKNVPVAQARPMALHIPTTATSRVDSFIDDLINVFLDTDSNLARQPHTVPLAMFLTSRPHAGTTEEPIARRPILSIPKLLAEGSPAERQIVLGWMIDARRLLISLPEDKFQAWVASIDNTIVNATCTRDDLETLVGQLNHAAHIIPMARHFMSRLRQLLHTTTQGNRRLHVRKEVADDLHLWKCLLTKANRGISINLIVTRRPSRLCWSDSCPFGIGGYSLVTGFAWRIRIPVDSIIYGSNLVNNLLEFLGMAINILLELKNCKRGEHDCILALGDNTSAVGWLHNTAKLGPGDGTRKAHLMVARRLAHEVLDMDCCIASQHIKGELNLVADLLSFAGSLIRAGGKSHPLAADDPPNDVLTQRLHSTYPDQIPAHFAISQLPDDILSWASRVLQTTALSLIADKRAATKTMTGSGADGSDSASTQAALLTPSSLVYPQSTENFSPAPSSRVTAPPSGPKQGHLMDGVTSRWSQVLCAKPQATWLRRFGTISNQAPFTSKGRPSCIPLRAHSSEPSKTSIQPLSAKKQLPPSCCDGCSA
jgi:hypothetical protein